MHKNLLALAAVIAATGFLAFGAAAILHSIPSSQAQDFGPVVTGGEAPWVTFDGEVAGNSTVTTYTVPSDRQLVITAACTNGPDMDLQELDTQSSTTTLAHGTLYSMVCNQGSVIGFLGRGRGHVAFAPGSQVRFRNRNGSTRRYTVNGYLAAP